MASRVPMTRSRARQLQEMIAESPTGKQRSASFGGTASSHTGAGATTTAVAASSNIPLASRVFRCLSGCRREAPTTLAGYRETAVQCRRCQSFQHAACVGLTVVSAASAAALSKFEREVAERELSLYVCGACLERAGVHTSLTGSASLQAILAATASTKRNGGASSSSQTQNLHPELALVETPDSPPANVRPFEAAIAAGRKFLQDSGCRLVLFGGGGGGGGGGEALTEAMREQVLACAASSVENATFSDAYPKYCVDEMARARHPYLQGAAAVCVATGAIVSVVFSNGRDPYCDLRKTVGHLRAQVTRKTVKLVVSDGDDDEENAASGTAKRRARSNSDARPTAASSTAANVLAQDADVAIDAKTGAILLRGRRARLTQRLLNDFHEFDAVVHFTFVVTLDAFRGKKLASTLLWIELARWAMRGRRHACVNLALQKDFDAKDVDEKGDAEAAGAGELQCSISEASRRLYTALHFVEVYPRYYADGSLRWTKAEEAAGRCMASLDFPTHFR